MATVAQTRDRAAEYLGILALGQALQSHHATRVEAAYTEVYAQLKADSLAVWPSSGDVPDELMPHVAALMAENCLPTYTVSDRRISTIANAVALAKVQIPAMVRQRYVSQSAPTDY